IKPSCPSVAGRPVGEAAPLIRTGFKKPRFRTIRVLLLDSVPFAFQMIHEKCELDILAIIFAGLGSKIEIAEPFTIAARPSSMRPRTHDQCIRRARAILFQRSK